MERDVFEARREAMVRRQIVSRGIDDPKILRAFLAIPREQFVSAGYADQSYEDHPLPIGCGQTISQPYIVALMIREAQIKPGDAVLEIGAGSGYAAAVMSRIAGRVTAIERFPELVSLARERIASLDLDNVSIKEGDGSRGCPSEAPFDAILAAASGSHVPACLLDQLAPGGRLVMPVGEPGDVQKLVKVLRRHDGSLEREDLGAVRFVPLVGEEGWKDG